MPFTTINSTTSTASGVVLANAATVDSTNGNQFANTGRQIIEINNTNGPTLNVTIVTAGVYTVGTTDYAIADLTATINNATTKVFGPFDTTLFNDTNNMVQVSFSANTNVTARVITLGTD
jgi:hypothetical protein